MHAMVRAAMQMVQLGRGAQLGAQQHCLTIAKARDPRIITAIAAAMTALEAKPSLALCWAAMQMVQLGGGARQWAAALLEAVPWPLLRAQHTQHAHRRCHCHQGVHRSIHQASIA